LVGPFLFTRDFKDFGRVLVGTIQILETYLPMFCSKEKLRQFKEWLEHGI